MTDSTFTTATTYQYDDQGRTVQIINDQGIINYAYNDLGQKVRTWTSTDSTGTDAVTDTRYTYDTLGRLSTVEVFERFNAYTPGAGTEPNTAEEVTMYHYDAVGNLDYTVMQDVDGSSITTDYSYDPLNRLDVLVQFVDSDANGTYDEATDEMVASYDYELDAAGNRISATETVDGYTYQWTWTYDALNRLTAETLDASDDSLDYTDTFTYDLAGNRLSLSHGLASDGNVEQTKSYFYDANDRLLAEIVDDATDDAKDRFTEYSYDNTQQTGKTTYQGTDNSGQIVSSTSYQYNELGRLSQVTETTYTDGVDPQTKTTDYEYNTQGLRVTETITDAEGEVTTKQYLFDTMNPTGYAQVLEEYINDQLAYCYTLGHDVISVAKAVGIPANGSGDTAATVYHLLTDGHGSTRLLANLTATTVALAQQYLYNAYGEMLEASHLATATTALTSLLYSGEWTNPNGTQYLRARYYDPATGSFNRLDPYAGNQNDPQSLHKYLYTHGNPIMGIDPSGEGEYKLTTVLVSVGLVVSSIGAGLWYYGANNNNPKMASIGQTTFFFGISIAASPAAAWFAGGSVLAPLGTIATTSLLYMWRLMVITSGDSVRQKAEKTDVAAGVRHLLVLSIANLSNNQNGPMLPDTGVFIVRNVSSYTALGRAGNVGMFSTTKKARLVGDLICVYKIKNQSLGLVDVTIFEIKSDGFPHMVYMDEVNVGGVLSGTGIQSVNSRDEIQSSLATGG